MVAQGSLQAHGARMPPFLRFSRCLLSGCMQVWLLTYVSAFNLLALPCLDNCLVLVDVSAGYKAIQTAPLGALVRGAARAIVSSY